MIYFVMMRVFNGTQEIGPGFPKSVILTIGNFDGVHRGHQELVSGVIGSARQSHLASVLMTFEPHPLKVLFPERGLKNIFEFSEKLEMIDRLGIDCLIVEPFSRVLSELSPEEFFSRFVVGKIHAASVHVGYDFNFGKNRAGTLDVLKNLCQKWNVKLQIVPPFKVEGEIVSSTQIRSDLGEGKVRKVEAFLGRPFFLKGIVEKGMGRGKKLGFPTANLFTNAEFFPRFGVYMTKADVDGQKHRSLTNVGLNPTFNDSAGAARVKVETHILDFQDDIYGEPLKVSFLDYLRPEVKFDSAALLVDQIREDVRMAEDFSWPKL